MIVFFDVDSTISSIEGCDLLAHKKGIGNQIEAITTSTMNGERDFDTAFPQKIDILSPSLSEIQRLGTQYCDHMTHGAQELITQLQDQGHTIAFVSHGFKDAIVMMAKKLGIDRSHVHALECVYDEDGTYQAIKKTPIVGEQGKARVIKTYRTNHPHETTLMIGDSISDMKAGQSVDICIGFGGVVQRPKVKAKAKIYIYELKKVNEYIQ